MAFLQRLMGHDGDSSEEEEEVALLEHEGGSSGSEESGEGGGRGLWRAAGRSPVQLPDQGCGPLQMMTAKER